MRTVLQIILACFCVAPLLGIAQNEPQVSHYMFSQPLYNPAAAGTANAISGSLLYNMQWAGFEGAPKAQGFNVHSPLGKSNSGIGLTATNQGYGVSKWQAFNMQYAYHVPFQKSHLSIGLQGGLQFYQEDGSKLITTNPGDAQYQQNLNLTTYNFGFGLHYYSDRFFVGASIPRLLDNKINAAEQDFSARKANFNEMDYYAIVGGVIGLGSSAKFLPSVLVKSFPGLPVAADINLNFMFKEVFWIGPYYRTNSAYGGMLGVQIGDNIKIGYAAELPSSDVSGYSSATHEIMVGFNFRKKGAAGYQSIRYF